MRVVWYGLLNKVLGITDYRGLRARRRLVADVEAQLERRRSQVPLLPILGSTSARVELTPLGDGSNWQIDDLYVDPCIGRIG